MRNGDIYVLNGSGTVTRITTNGGGQPAWSPDGNKIAFVRSNQIYVVNANGSGVTRLTNDAAIDRDPAWAPTGTKIAFASNRTATGRFEIYLMNANGSGVTRLTTNLPFQGCGGTSRGAEGSPTWSPDGSRIAFLHKTTCFSKDIDVMNANGSGVARLTNAGFAARLAWGRTGKIAFDPRVLPGEGFSDGEIEVVTVSGATVTRLTNNSVNDLSPTWSPDGSRIAFASDRTGNLDIFAMNADGSGITRLTSNSAFESEPAWGS